MKILKLWLVPILILTLPSFRVEAGSIYGCAQSYVAGSFQDPMNALGCTPNTYASTNTTNFIRVTNFGIPRQPYEITMIDMEVKVSTTSNTTFHFYDWYTPDCVRQVPVQWTGPGTYTFNRNMNLKVYPLSRQ